MTLMFWALLLVSIVPVPSSIPHLDDMTFRPEPSLLFESLKVSVLGISIAALIWRHAFAGLLLREVNRFLIVFMLLALASVTWSIEPGYTLRRFVLLGTSAIAAWACVSLGWHDRRFQQILRAFFTALTVGSIIFGIFWPDLAKEHGDTISLAGAWRGLTGQKNALGHAGTLCVLFWMHGLLTREVKFRQFILGCGAGAACVVLSRSSTAIFNTILCAMLLLLLLKGPVGRRRLMTFLIIVFVILILVYSLAALNVIPGLDFLLQPFVALTGKDATFSGRTHIWAVLREHISHHPLLGTGYGAYWIGPVPGSPSLDTMLKYSNYYPSEGHNGYLDMLNDLGAVGLVCLLGFLLTYLRQALVLLRLQYNQATIYVAFLFEELVTNMTSSDWLEPLASPTPIVLLATFAMARTLVDYRLRGQDGPGSPRVQPVPLPSAPPPRGGRSRRLA